MREGKKKSTAALFVSFLFLFIVGVLLLVLSRDGVDCSTKMKWGIGVGLVIGSITYFVDWIILKIRTKYRDKQIILIILFLTFLFSYFMAGLIVLSGCNDGPDDWRLLGLGTGLFVGAPVVLIKHASMINSKMLWWIPVGILIFTVVVIIVMVAIT